MRLETTWWRNLGGLLAACVLALLVVAPTASMAACVCDNIAVTITVGAAADQAVQGDHGDDRAPCEAACCVSGHCHHGGSMLDTPAAAVPTPAPVVTEHALAATDALASRTISGPDRPPRA